MRTSFLLLFLVGCPAPKPTDTGRSDDTGDTDTDTDSDTDTDYTTDPIVDEDGDGYGADVDCDDDNADVNPDVFEACNGVDDNCNGEVDEGVMSTWYADMDADGYGSAASPANACEAPSGYVADATDCDDAHAAAHPGATERYGDTIDDDCDGSLLPSRTYCTPNVPTTYASVDDAVTGGATSICLDAGTYSSSHTVSIPVSGQGMGVSTYVGDIAGDATDLTLDGNAAGMTSHTLTRVDALGEVSTSCDSYSGGFTGPSVTVYSSILEGGLAVSASMTNLRGTCSATAYDTYISGGHDGYGIYVYAYGAASYAYPGYATVDCYNCTILGPATGAYSVYSQYFGVATLNLYNSVYEPGTVYSYQGYYATTTVTTTSSSEDTAALDTSTVPPTPTGVLIDGGDAGYGSGTDFWGVTRTGTPDVGAVEAP